MTEGRLSEHASFLGLDRLPQLQGVAHAETGY
jgi:hypothetical protein